MEEKQNACFLDAQPSNSGDRETGTHYIGREYLKIPLYCNTNDSYSSIVLERPPKMKWRNISTDHPIPVRLEQYESVRNDPEYSRKFFTGFEMGKLILVDDSELPIIDIEQHLMPEGADA